MQPVIRDKEPTRPDERLPEIFADQASPRKPALQNSIAQTNERKMLTWRTRPDHRLNGQFIEHIQILQDDFAKGNNHAGFILATNLLTCSRAASTKEELDSEVDYWIRDGQRQSMIDSHVSRFHFCEGISSDDRRQPISIFTRLAESNFTPALEVLGTMPDKTYMELTDKTQLERNDYISEKVEFQKAKYKYITRAAEQGSMKALLRLTSLAQHKPSIIEFNDATGYSSVSLALANAIVLKYFTEDNATYSRADFQYNKQFELATPQEVDLADELADEIILKVKSFGEAYPEK